MKGYFNFSFIFMMWALLNILLSSKLKAQTILHGAIVVDSTLSLTNSPYQVTGNLLIGQNVTLKVEAGVVVKFNPNIQLLLRGKLEAKGTLQDTIYFTSDNSSLNSWAGIKIDNFAGAKIECSYFRARFASELLNQNRDIGTDTTIKVTHSLLDSNQKVMTMINLIGTNTKQYFDSCVFTNNGIVSTNAFSCSFKNSTFSNGDAGVFSTDTSSQTTKIDNCTFYNFRSFAANDKVFITNSIFYDNNIAIGLSYYTFLRYNNIYNNAIGIETFNVIPNKTNFVTGNRICNNGYNVKLNNSADFIAVNDCWCSIDSAQIRATMIDFFSFAGLGIVRFKPFDTTCNFSTTMQNEIESNFSFLLYPNPVTNYLTLILSSNISLAKLNIFNTLGELEFSCGLTMQETNIDVSTLAKGIHILEITDKKNVSRRKLIKQ